MHTVPGLDASLNVGIGQFQAPVPLFRFPLFFPPVSFAAFCLPLGVPYGFREDVVPPIQVHDAILQGELPLVLTSVNLQVRKKKEKKKKNKNITQMVSIFPHLLHVVNYTHKRQLHPLYLVILANNYILGIEKLLVFLITDIIATIEGFLKSNKEQETHLTMLKKRQSNVDIKC